MMPVSREELTLYGDKGSSLNLSCLWAISDEVVLGGGARDLRKEDGVNLA
ncbi:uncharacterized protein FIESC28_07081 [Fusarium coffeatum]|uniref:Uncharacterized protein n=1 Tax=Fusarium coffeatum TaxID=231269 RepID=A0A366RG05_9HYPO|nr:uncharacterized protein FIESC28_07081 [Fusarium coffeatum]RBR16061.1 hypothetical protein FIESC28_07081 [Fusarium coffeatum]